MTADQTAPWILRRSNTEPAAPAEAERDGSADGTRSLVRLDREL
jgi:hypothetical protein